MSSITTAIPTGPISGDPSWCITNMLEVFGADQVPYTYFECANSTAGTKKEDFQTICCDGDIIDSTYNFWTGEDNSEYVMDIKNLVCCRQGGQLLPGGIMPIDTDYTRCEASQKPEPLASLAATNTKNAELYTLTYESASAVATGGFGDWTVTDTPTCLWIQTAHPNISLADVTVPAAEITTLPRPTTDAWGFPITSTASDVCRWGNSAASCSDIESTTTDSSSTPSTQSTSPTETPSDPSVAGAAAPTSSAELSKGRNGALMTSIGLFLGVLNTWMR